MRALPILLLVSLWIGASGCTILDDINKTKETIETASSLTSTVKEGIADLSELQGELKKMRKFDRPSNDPVAVSTTAGVNLAFVDEAAAASSAPILGEALHLSLNSVAQDSHRFLVPSSMVVEEAWVSAQVESSARAFAKVPRPVFAVGARLKSISIRDAGNRTFRLFENDEWEHEAESSEVTAECSVLLELLDDSGVLSIASKTGTSKLRLTTSEAKTMVDKVELSKKVARPESNDVDLQRLQFLLERSLLDAMHGLVPEIDEHVTKAAERDGN